MSITVITKKAIEAVNRYKQGRDLSADEAASFLICYADNRLAALAKYQTKELKTIGADKPKKPRLAGLLKKKDPPGEARAAKKVTDELGKISKILRFQEAKAAKQKKSVAVQESGKAGAAIGTLPTLVFEGAKKPTKTSFSKKFKK